MYRTAALALLSLASVTVAPNGMSAQAPTVRRSTVEVRSVPPWLYAPQNIRLVQPAGSRLELLTIAVASSEYYRESILVGMFRNLGRALNGVHINLMYLDSDGETFVRLTENTARVRTVPSNGTIPFRFALFPRTLLPEGPFVFRMEVVETPQEGQRVSASLTQHAIRSRGERGVHISVQFGTVSMGESATDALAVTLLLLDKERRLLDVLSGQLRASTASLQHVDLESRLPLAGRVKHLELYVESLPAPTH